MFKKYFIETALTELMSEATLKKMHTMFLVTNREKQNLHVMQRLSLRTRCPCPGYQK